MGTDWENGITVTETQRDIQESCTDKTGILTHPNLASSALYC